MSLRGKVINLRTKVREIFGNIGKGREKPKRKQRGTVATFKSKRIKGLATGTRVAADCEKQSGAIREAGWQLFGKTR